MNKEDFKEDILHICMDLVNITQQSNDVDDVIEYVRDSVEALETLIEEWDEGELYE